MPTKKRIHYRPMPIEHCQPNEPRAAYGDLK